MAIHSDIYNHGVPWEEGFSVTQARRVDGIIYVSGQFSHDMQSGFVGEGDFEAQARKSLENLDRVLAGFDATKSDLAETITFSDEIQIEDIGICEAVQRGLASETYVSGRYSPQRENGVHHFHELYARDMGISKLA